ncbi:MAG: tRNA uridine-5-carboxymethylaminomethyl(34) synthesis enzyme MnmG, partial [Oscillospiraceae bacterium]|nr:tRNA uridine-5-carboxymethylaminomethyl(34) synthesis enzyme MnmG [Oscillospiraceae bacterium]
SSSLPEDVQNALYHTMDGLADVHIMRPAYAIEYDCVDPTELLPTLESKGVPGLYGAGQFNGSSGYEEAAAQGFVAGVNAALKLQGREPMIIDRSEAYIGALIDDLVTKGTSEPYRMMTSRSEYRLILRQDNADIRMAETGRRIGLISRERYEAVKEKYRSVEEEIKRLERTYISPSDELEKYLSDINETPPHSGISLADLIRRPAVDYFSLAPFDPGRPELPKAVGRQAETELKYEGYIKRQLKQVEEFRRLESRRLPADINYMEIQGIRIEARQKLSRIRPANFGQASRISGVNPSDIAALMIWLDRK